MKSKIFRFSLLSIFCVYVTASVAFAHTYPDGYLLRTIVNDGNTIEVRVGDNAKLTGHENPDGAGWHRHTYTYTIVLDGNTIEITNSRVVNASDTETDDPPPTDNTPVDPLPTDTNTGDPPPTDNNPQIRDSKVDLYHCHSGGWHYHRGVANEEGFADNHDNHHNDHSKTGYEVDDQICRNTEKLPDDNTGGTRDSTTTSPTNTDQPPPPTTTPIVVVGGGPPAVEERGTLEGTSSPQPGAPVATGSAPQETQPESPLMLPIRVTEYMVRDWSRGVWGGNLPQWIELQNPNAAAVNLKGYTFQYATRRFANSDYTIHTLTLASAEDDTDGFVIAGGGVAILVTHHVPSRKFSGIKASQVYDLDIENVLKRGWVLTDAEGREVHRIGKDVFNALRNPVAPPHQEAARVSYHTYPSEAPTEAYYYGYNRDIGSPGFYEPLVPKAPSAIRAKRVGTWAALKRSP